MKKAVLPSSSFGRRVGSLCDTELSTNGPMFIEGLHRADQGRRTFLFAIGAGSA